jgi:hypothetical protein
MSVQSMTAPGIRGHAVSDIALRRLAAVGWLLTVAVTVAALAIRVISGAPPLPNRFGFGDAAAVAFGINQLASVTAAVVVLWRLPRQRVAWLLLGTGGFYAIAMVATAIAFAAAADPTLGLGLARWAGWVAWLGVTAAGYALGPIVLLFPDGRPVSREFSRIAVPLILGSLVFLFSVAVQPGPMWLLSTLDNPIGIGPNVMAAVGPDYFPIVSVASGVILLFIGTSVAWRYRVSTGTERQQLKWFLAAATLTLGSFGVTLGIAFGAGGLRSELPLIAFGLASASIPVAIGVAILRYRLYEIDRIISRTLAYAALTATLAIVYVAAFIALQAVLAPFTQGGGPLAVAASTLAVFALFQPLRRRLQTQMDRRFNRSRYDAQRTVAAFASQLRDEVDLDRLGGVVQTVVGQTLAPASVGIWLRPSGRAADR